jgi:type VII secretion-associated serine protease mycosin
MKMTTISNSTRACNFIIALAIVGSWLIAIDVRIARADVHIGPSGAVVDRTPVSASEWWIPRWGLADVWKVTKGAGVTVAVVDSGVDASRPELGGAVVPGVDFSGHGADGRVDTDPVSHGTVIAELIAARGFSSGMLIGVAPRVRILPVTIGVAGKFPDAIGVATANAIRWAVDHGASVVNMSYGGVADECVGVLRDAIWYALDRNVSLVAGSGNDGKESNMPVAPALCPGVISVGAVDEQGRPWVNTARQRYVDVAGPGVNIVGIDKRGVVTTGSGTSEAAALVSGVVALLRARFPEMSARQIVTRLLATAKDAGAPGRDDQTGYGIVRPLNALTEDVPADAPNPVYEEVDRLRGAAGTHPPAVGTGHKDSGNLPLAVGLGAVAAGLTALVMLLVWRWRRSRPGSGRSVPHAWRSP